MRPPKSHKAIIEKLAFSAPQTIYRLSKETGHSTSTIHAALKKLSTQRLIKKHQKRYVLSFVGLMDYLISRFPDPHFGNEDMKKIIQTYSSIIDYPLLSLYQSFEKWLGDEFYETLHSAVYIANQRLVLRLPILVIEAPRRLKSGERVQRARPPTLEEVENVWKHALALSFFDFHTAKPEGKKEPPEDPAIQRFIKKTFETEVSKKKQEITKLESTLHRLIKPT